MKKINPFRGLGVALVTPFYADGSIDFGRLSELADYQITHGADFLCILGTTAETPCLTAAEKRAVIEELVEVNDGRVPLLLGAGGNNTAEVVEYLKEGDFDGIDGVLIVAPYYNKPTQEGLYRHFCAVADATVLPVVLYNVPGRTGVNISAETTLRLANDCENVVAIKEASGNMEQIRAILEGATDGFELLSGDDALTLDILQAGGTGVISVIGNAYPEYFGQIVHEAMNGNVEAAKAVNDKLSPMYPLMTVDGNPAGIKALLELRGMIDNVLRLPLVPAREETSKDLARAILQMY